jgi:hypothetical protein
LLLLLIKFYTYYFTNIENPTNKEGFGDAHKEGFKEGLDIGKEIRKVFEKPFKELRKQIEKPFKPMIDAFKEFPKRFTLIGRGFKNIFEGIGDQFKYLGIGIGRGIEDIGLLIAYSSVFVFSYVICGVKYISNLPNCIFYYVVDALIQILYLPIRITLWILASFLRINLYPTEKKLWEYAQWVDSKIYTVAGFNLLRWPKNIRDQCYNCKRLKTSVLKNKAKEVDYDFKVGIPKLIKKGTDRIMKGGNEMKRAFGV